MFEQSNRDNASVMAKKRKFSGGWAGVASWDEGDETIGEVVEPSPRDVVSPALGVTGAAAHKNNFAGRRKLSGNPAEPADAITEERTRDVISSSSAPAKKQMSKPSNGLMKSKSRTDKKGGALENLPVSPPNKKKRVAGSSVS